MDTLDVVIIIFLVLAALHGVRLGAAVQVLSFAGALIGLCCGVALIIVISPHVHGVFLRSFVGRQIGAHVWRRLRGHRFAAIDAGTGALVAMAGTLVVVWVLAAFLSNSEVGAISSQIENSAVVRFVTKVMPPIPSELANRACVLEQRAGLPIPCLGILAPTGPVAVASSGDVRRAELAASRSTVQITAVGCGIYTEEGSGFVVAPGLVVTNAHVVAGATHIDEYDNVQTEQASVVLFDPNFDIAVLRVPNLGLPALRVVPNYVGRGTKAVVFGYPLGGDFNAQPAGVLARFDAESPNIYDTGTTQRQIYEVHALVRPGNSGGPLLEPDGKVIGVVFSRSTTNSEIGFALASPAVLKYIRQAESRPVGSTVGTGQCISS
jgi:Trypsin-like peptidase domain